MALLRLRKTSLGCNQLTKGRRMIRYSLHCAEGHDFDSWFQSAEAFDTLADAGHLTCAVCGSSDVTKALMAPKVSNAKPSLTKPANEQEAAIEAIRDKVEASATYVGGGFAKEARAMHEGEKPDRAIWGQANATEAKALIDDGISVAPLPFGPRNKAN